MALLLDGRGEGLMDKQTSLNVRTLRRPAGSGPSAAPFPRELARGTSRRRRAHSVHRGRDLERRGQLENCKHAPGWRPALARDREACPYQCDARLAAERPCRASRCARAAGSRNPTGGVLILGVDAARRQGSRLKVRLRRKGRVDYRAAMRAAVEICALRLASDCGGMNPSATRRWSAQW